MEELIRSLTLLDCLMLALLIVFGGGLATVVAKMKGEDIAKEKITAEAAGVNRPGRLHTMHENFAWNYGLRRFWIGASVGLGVWLLVVLSR